MISSTSRKALVSGAFTLTVVLIWLLTVQAATCNLIITNKENGRNFKVKVGQKLTVNLRDPGGGGYNFLTPEYDQSILKMVGERHLPRTEPPRMGDFGRKVYEFQAVKDGQTNLVIPIKRPWEKQSETYLKVTISVRP
jgi:predicted secreted protein